MRGLGGVFIFCFFVISTLFAQRTDNLQFQRISIEHGLSHTLVNRIFQDSQGFLWVATEDGLNRYDGYEFKVYRKRRGDDNSIISNTLKNIDEDRDNNLWFSTFREGLSRFDRTQDRFYNYRHDDDDENSLLSLVINDVVVAKNESVWIATNGGLSLFDKEKDAFINFRYHATSPNSLPNESVKRIREDGFGNIWIGTQDGLAVINQESKEIVHVNGLTNQDINVLYMDSTDIMWVGTANGLNRIRISETFADNAQPEIHSILFDDIPEFVQNINNILAVYRSSTGDLWVGTGLGVYIISADGFREQNPKHLLFEEKYRNSRGENEVRNFNEDSEQNIWMISSSTAAGLLRYDQKEGSLTQFLHDELNPKSISNSKLSHVLIDDAGVLWCSGEKAGLNRCDLKKKKFNLINYQPGKNSLNSNDVYSIIKPVGTNQLWVGTISGLNYLDLNSGQWNIFEHSDPSLNMPNSRFPGSLYQFDSDKVWVGFWDGQLSYFDIANERFVNYEFDPEDPNSLTVWSIRAIHQDKTDDQIIWFGGAQGPLVRLDQRSTSYTYFERNSTDPESYNGEGVLFIHEDGNGFLWIGGRAGGLNRLNKRTGKFKYWIEDPDDPNSIASNELRTIYADEENSTYWIGTAGGGLCKFDPRMETFKNYTLEDGLAGNLVQGIIPDDHGNLWISTTNGISKFDPVAETFRNYTEQDGLQSTEFNENTRHVDQEGIIYFGGVKGLNYFHSDSIYENEYIAPLHFTNLRIFNDPVPIGKMKNGRTVLKGLIDEVDEVNLSYKDKIFTIEFSALHFAAPEKIQYKYMLEGFDDEWVITSSDKRFATYSNLSGGEYEFKLMATNSDDVWNPEAKSVRIVVDPPFWQTYWFYMLVALGLAGIFYVILKIRERQARRDKQILEKTIAKKTDELEEKTAEILRRNEEDKAKNWLANSLNEVTQTINSNKDDLYKLGNAVLLKLVKITGVQMGTILFVNNENENDKFLEVISVYAGESEVSGRIELNEGLPGQCFKDGEVNYITNLPPGYAKVISGLGESELNNLLLVPMKLDEISMGVIELLSFKPLKPEHIELTKKVGELVTSNLYILKTNTVTKGLLEQSKSQQEELKAQEEELRQHLEEMSATQEDFHRREKELMEEIDELTSKLENNSNSS